MKVTGEYRLNGHEYDTKILKSMSAYVMQDDLLHAELTVGETLHWAAELRMPASCPPEERIARVRHLTKLMGIGHCEHTIVGNTRRKGISGGERKRLCVAIELLNHPKLLFLDEPTSGLDSTTAFSVCQALHQLAESGECTVVCTIHQPAPNAFELFDNLILMKNGEALYQGASKGVIPFLAQIGYPYKFDVNLAEHLIDAISPQGGVSNEKLHEHSMNVLPIDLSLGNEMYDFSEFTDWRTLVRRTLVLTRRNFTQEVRNWDRFLLCLAATLLIAFFTSGGIWEQLGHDQNSVKKIPGAVFFCYVNQGVYSSLVAINSFPGERAIMLRERQAGAYNTLSYFTAKSITDTIVMIPMPILFSVIVYPMYGLTPTAPKFFLFTLFIMLGSTCATALATFGKGKLSCSLFSACRVSFHEQRPLAVWHVRFAAVNIRGTACVPDTPPRVLCILCRSHLCLCDGGDEHDRVQSADGGVPPLRRVLHLAPPAPRLRRVEVCRLLQLHQVCFRGHHAERERRIGVHLRQAQLRDHHWRPAQRLLRLRRVQHPLLHRHPVPVRVRVSRGGLRGA